MADQFLPDVLLYLLPSVRGLNSIRRRHWLALLERIQAGATLYISLDDAVLSGLNEAAGVEMLTRAQSGQPFEYQLGESTIHARGETRFTLRATRAEVLARDADGNPILTHAPYGKGHVYLLTHPLELEQTLTPGAFQRPGAYRVYETISAQARATHIGRKTSPMVGMTEHPVSLTERILVFINYGKQDIQSPFALAPGWQADHVFYGHPGFLSAHDALVLKVKKRPEG